MQLCSTYTSSRFFDIVRYVPILSGYALVASPIVVRYNQRLHALLLAPFRTLLCIVAFDVAELAQNADFMHELGQVVSGLRE